MNKDLPEIYNFKSSECKIVWILFGMAGIYGLLSHYNIIPSEGQFGVYLIMGFALAIVARSFYDWIKKKNCPKEGN